MPHQKHDMEEYTNYLQALRALIQVGIQVPKEIKIAIELHKKNDNTLWDYTVELALKKIKHYQTFTVLYPGESIPS
jgi:hypothetical protein